MKNHELLKLTAHQVEQGNYDKAILAVGSCEAHGQHLASGTDTLVSYMLSCEVAQQVDGLLVLPPVTVGYSAHYDSFPFTLSLEYGTIMHVVYDILASTISNGIQKIFIMNGHDGNISAIESACRQIKERFPKARLAVLPAWWVTARQLLPEDTFEVWNGLGHAGEGESSIAYHLFPQWCEPELAAGVVPDQLPEYIDIMWDFAELTDNAATGGPTKGTAEKGKKMMDALTRCVVDSIKKLDERNWDYTSSKAAQKFE
jgi:creatinine amidohydrolase